ncbi:hypothetical protein CO680_03485 [Weissella paramesenteroides]|uniref:Cell wall elongation regulator TseB-like domain-containing protein n=2 Tax=Weissella paramesenteroides TaxID=1249 RepID=C5RBP4_WEIPA|nr:hypothetical protein CO680_03485 [Weissella paramesenteroides]EER74384.1 hypothetical protein HMPREF0877_1390 [Weissella paramesenteroides ATCC 33313]
MVYFYSGQKLYTTKELSNMEMRSTVHGRRGKRLRHWLLGILMFLFIILIGVSILGEAQKPVDTAKERVTKIAKQSNKLTSVSKFYRISRQKVYYSAVGENKKHQKVGVIVQGKSDKLTTINMTDGLSEKQVKKLANKQFHPKKVTSIGLALYKQVPVWQLTFVDKDNNLNFITYQFSDGKQVQTIRHL